MPERESDEQFLEAVRAFLDAHWRDAAGAPRRAVALAFAAALADRGWSVPGWPIAEGGTGWSRRRHYLFARELARAGAPAPDGFTVDVVGPLLMAMKRTRRVEKALEAIRAGRERWCGHPSLSGAPPPAVGLDGGTFRLESPPLHARRARGRDWLLLVARPHTGPTPAGRGGAPLLLAVPLAPATVTAGLPLDPDTITFSDRKLAGAMPMGRPGQAEALLAAVRSRARALPGAPASRLRYAFERLGGADQEIDRRQRSSMGVELLGLEALEARVAADAGGSAGGAARRAMLASRVAGLAEDIAMQALTSAGYHALPAPNPLAVDNEGPVSERWSWDAMADLFGYVDALEDAADKDAIAQMLDRGRDATDDTT